MKEQFNFPQEAEPSGFEISGYVEAVDYLNNKIKELESELIRHFNGDTSARDEFVLNTYINGVTKTLSLLEEHKDQNKTHVLKDELLSEVNLSDKPGVSVFKLGEDFVAKQNPSLEDSFKQVEVSHNIESPRIHIISEIGFIKEDFYALMSLAHGKPIKRGERIELNQEEKNNLYSDIKELESNKVGIDISKHNNFYYEKGEGVHFIDLTAQQSIAENLNNFFQYFENTSLEEYKEFH